MESTFERRENKEIATTLQDLNTTYQSLKDIPEFKTYRHSLALYTDKLESLVRPRLLQAFSKHSTEEALEAITILQQIGRIDQAYQLYHKARIVPLTQSWKSFDPAPPAASTDPKPAGSIAQPPVVQVPVKPMSQWLSNFYNELMLFLSAEVRTDPFVRRLEI